VLPKKYRLKKEKDFELVFKRGKKANSDSLFLKFKKNNLFFSRFGFSVGKKISKKAVIRNKIKRKLSNIIYKKIKNIKSGFDVIIIVTYKILDKNYQEIEVELNKLLNKANLL